MPGAEAKPITTALMIPCQDVRQRIVAALPHPVHDQPTVQGPAPRPALGCSHGGDGLSAALALRGPRAAHAHGGHATEILANAGPGILSFTAFPVSHKKQVWSNNSQGRLDKEIGRRADVVVTFPNRASIRRLIGAVLAEQHEESGRP